MAARAQDDDVDRLYQLPIAEFTAARNALAAHAGADRAAIRALQKPTAPAWAVNQLYWKRRRVFDRLVAAAEGLRTAHARRLAGKAADVERAELVHGAAVKAAVDAAAELLAAAGDPATSATTHAITETLQAMPWPDPPGRLTRALRPQGFAALAGLLPKGGAAARHVAEVVEIDRTRRQRERAETAADRATREEAERRRETAAVERSLATARVQARKAAAALKRSRASLARAETQRGRLSRALDEATAEVQTLRETLNEDTRRARDTEAEAQRLDDRLRQLRPE